jgi:predicted small lipoprotein YifL
MWLRISVGIIVVFALSLQGCGRKGPLTLPAPVAHKASAVPDTTTEK